MFCSECGKTLVENAKFCASCGIATSGADAQTIQEPDTGEPLIVLQPQFIGWVTALSVLPIQLFITVWGAGFFGGFGLFAIKALELPVPSWFTFVFFGCLFFFGIPLLAYMARKKTYAQTEYRFYSTLPSLAALAHGVRTQSVVDYLRPDSGQMKIYLR